MFIGCGFERIPNTMLHSGVAEVVVVYKASHVPWFYLTLSPHHLSIFSSSACWNGDRHLVIIDTDFHGKEKGKLLNTRRLCFPPLMILVMNDADAILFMLYSSC